MRPLLSPKRRIIEPLEIERDNDKENAVGLKVLDFIRKSILEPKIGANPAEVLKLNRAAQNLLQGGRRASRKEPIVRHIQPERNGRAHHDEACSSWRLGTA